MTWLEIEGWLATLKQLSSIRKEAAKAK